MTYLATAPALRRAGRIAIAIALSASVTLGASACGSSSDVTAPLALGVFDASVTGASQLTAKGQSAVFYLPASGSVGASYLLLMRDTTAGVSVAVEWDNVATLAVGTTNVGVADGQATALFSDAAGTPYDGTSGTVTIATSSPAGIASGSFSLVTTARNGSATVNVTGTFSGAPIVLNPGS